MQLFRPIMKSLITTVAYFLNNHEVAPNKNVIAAQMRSKEYSIIPERYLYSSMFTNCTVINLFLLYYLLNVML